MIINLRGCNGSGKSTVAFDLMAKCPAKLIQPVDLARYETPKGAVRFVPGYWLRNMDLIIVGPYRTQCGGCDGIKTQDLIKSSVRHAAKLAQHVFFEGVIVSTLFSGWLDFSQDLAHSVHGPMTWAYLDTPVELCLSRIAKRNGGKAFNEQLVRDKLRSISATASKAVAAGERIVSIDYRKATKQILELYNE